MSADIIQCPACEAEISISCQLKAEAEFEMEKKYKRKISALEKKSAEATEQLKKQEEKNKKEMEKQMRAEMESTLKTEKKTFNEQLLETKKQLDESKVSQLSLMKEVEATEERIKHFDLEVMKSVAEAKIEAEKETTEKISENYRRQLQESEKKLADATKNLENAKRQIEQGSQQLQGEVLELSVERSLKSQFPIDDIVPVKNGVRGGDIVQKVMTPSGQMAGTIIWECKDTKTWNDSWLEKLKSDKRSIVADIAVIITYAMPKGIQRLGLVDGVWIVDAQAYSGLALALRMHLVQLAYTKASVAGRGEKMEILYDYLTGTAFKQRIEGVVESFIAMEQELSKEMRFMERTWSAQKQNISRAIAAASGMHGDMQGIVGDSLPKVALLEFEVESAV